MNKCTFSVLIQNGEKIFVADNQHFCRECVPRRVNAKGKVQRCTGKNICKEVGKSSMYEIKDRAGVYHWMQRELETELKKFYKIHRIRVIENNFYIWFLDNEDSVSIPLSVMDYIFNDGKNMKNYVL